MILIWSGLLLLALLEKSNFCHVGYDRKKKMKPLNVVDVYITVFS